MKRITVAAAILLAAAPWIAPCAAWAAEAAPVSFVAATFAVPTSAQGASFQLKPLGPDLVRIDFDAYMSSVEHLQQTFTRSTDWPHAGISDADALLDMQTEAGRFARRESFAYSVLTPDGKRERGCVYVAPSPVPGYDAVVRIWVTKAEYDAGFDKQLESWAHQWIAAKWPFRKVAWPGRDIDWATWDALAAKKGA